jgi:hypothetical protein
VAPCALSRSPWLVYSLLGSSRPPGVLTLSEGMLQTAGRRSDVRNVVSGVGMWVRR